MKQNNFIFVLYGVSLFCLRAQYLDSLHEVFRSRSSPDVRLESRWSFLNGNILRIEGYRLGVSFRKKIRIGGGISWIKSPYTELFPNTFPDGSIFYTKKYLHFFYLCYYIDFVFHKTKRWQLSTPLQFGAGWYAWKNTLPRFPSELPLDYFLYLYEPGINIQYKFFPFLGVGFDVCYRFGNADTGYLKMKFHSPTYGIKILFWVHQLYYTLFPNSDLTRKFGPASW